tara:strand:- start:13 stop:345 length:333 start_codon:yes stop_codon:yes gene_type:complete
MTSIVTITESAKEKVIAEMEVPGDNLRLAVKGGGCSGMTYELFSESPDKVQDIDTVFPNEGFDVVIDQKSSIYLKGMNLDYQGGIQGKGFIFNNPLATSSCGCGESFSVT